MSLPPPVQPAREWLLAHRATRWRTARRELEFGAWPRVMGIVNVTPDSFSDGGRFADVERAIAHGLQLADAGADILDIGGESTRPYAEAVPLEEELRRVVPVVAGLAARCNLPLSIDTAKAAVARAACEAGAEIINDVTGLAGDPAMVAVAREFSAGVCVMHMQGTPRTMQDNPQYGDVVAEIRGYLANRAEHLVAAGVDPTRLCLDPGIGFGKTHEHNWTLLEQCWQFHALGYPLLVGHSRKGFIGKWVGSNELSARDRGTAEISWRLAQQGIQIVRVHDVAGTRARFLAGPAAS